MRNDATFYAQEPLTIRRQRRYRIWIFLGAVSALGALLFALAWWNDSRKTDLNSLMGSPIVTDINPVDVTDTYCPGRNCVSAWETDVGRYVQFVHEGDAEYWQQVLGDDSRRDRHVLLDMSEKDLDQDGVKNAVDTLFLNRDWT